MRRFMVLLAVLAAAAALLAAACGDDGENGDEGASAGDGGGPAATTPADDGAAAAPTEPPGMEAGATVTVYDHPDLGPILADADGRVLYVFTRDEGGVSNCYDQCADNWPPLTADGGTPAAGDGVTGALDVTERTDGSMQVTYDGMPLYYFAGDAAPGDANGQGVGDVWFVVEATGAASGGGSDDDAGGSLGY